MIHYNGIGIVINTQGSSHCSARSDYGQRISAYSQIQVGRWCLITLFPISFYINRSSLPQAKIYVYDTLSHHLQW